MNETEALLGKAKESLDAARSLLRDSYPDFSASRAYYAMLYAVTALLAIRGQSYRKHSAIISAFGREYAKPGLLDSKFHQWLLAAQNYRNIGDYGIEAHVSDTDAELVCTWAQELIEATESYLLRNRDKQP